jgi:hypothetical protein
MTKDKALQMCLEYIETNAHERRCVRWAIKDALAQPEQDAAAFIAAEDRKVASRYGYVPKLHPSEWQVANPERPWVGLTEVDILAASRHWRHAEDFMAGVYWAAGTLKEKNT